jgi:hypothetical protein
MSDGLENCGYRRPSPTLFSTRPFPPLSMTSNPGRKAYIFASDVSFQVSNDRKSTVRRNGPDEEVAIIAGGSLRPSLLDIKQCWLVLLVPNREQTSDRPPSWFPMPSQAQAGASKKGICERGQSGAVVRVKTLIVKGDLVYWYRTKWYYRLTQQLR